MTAPPEKQNSRLMREMFNTIAPRYDFITRAFSFGMDGRWKRIGVAKPSLPENARVLDLACGTGDISRLLLERIPHARTISVDITERMLRIARQHGLADVVCGNAVSLPFADGAFDCVFIGYGLRNFPDLNAAIGEIQRVTKPGGMMVSLDFFLPANTILRRTYLAWLYTQGAAWGLLLHGRARIYTYIPDSLRSFMSVREFSSLLQRLGYESVNDRAYIFGCIGMHWATKK
jgi:demethylmenaquinone methyltransferase/2-methoxy-6-polyprenyl-1,4-benzoquinol methylase